MVAFSQQRIFIVLTCVLLALLALFWPGLNLPRFSGDVMLRPIVFVAAVANATGALLGRKGIKVLLAVNSFCLAILALEIFLVKGEPEDFARTPTPRIGKRRDLARRWHVDNVEIPSGAEILTIGDSQTRGINVPEQDSWPHVISRLCRCEVHNLAFGGLSPPQYWTLLQRAMEFTPRVVIVGLYLGNDVWDSFSIVYKDEKYRFLRTEHGAQIKDTTELDAKKILDAVKRLEDQYRTEHSHSLMNFWHHSSLVKLWRSSIPASQYDFMFQKKAWVESHPKFGSAYENAKVRTILTSGYRLLGADLARPANQEGLLILKKLLKRMQSETARSGTKLLIALIPTKETVFAQLVKPENGDSHLPLLIASENRIRGQLLNFCEKNGIQCVDTLHALRKSAADIQLYPPGDDSHPSKEGYAQIATVISDKLNALSWLSQNPMQ